MTTTGGQGQARRDRLPYRHQRRHYRRTDQADAGDDLIAAR